jgi:putative peptidoglycan lipid II flippase
MVKRLLSIFHREVRGLHEAAYLLGLFAFLSQLLAILRDRLFAASFGAGSVLDIYYAAFRVPDFIFVTVASIVAVSVLVPFIVNVEKAGRLRSTTFVNSIFSFFFLLVTVVSAAAFMFMPELSSKLFFGFDETSRQSLIELSRILLLSPILLGISNFFGSITQAASRFFVYAMSPILYNLGIILGILVFYPIWGLNGLGAGVVFGAFLHMAIQVPAVRAQGLFPRFTPKPDWREIKEVILSSVPRTIALAASQLVILYFLSLSSLFGEGSIAVFNLAWNLQSVPLSIIGVSYSLAAFPALSKLFANGSEERFTDQLLSATRHILFWSVPITVLFIVLRAQIVRTILGAGLFTWQDTRLTAAALALFAVSVVAQSLSLLFVRAYYAIGNTKTPLIINLFSAFLSIGFSVYLLFLFNNVDTFRFFVESLLRVSDLPSTAILILPLAYSVGMLFNAILLWLRLKFLGKSKHLFRQTFFQSFSASVLMGFAAYLALNVFDDVFNLNTFIGIFLQGLCAGLIGIVVFALVLKLLKNTEMVEVWQTLHKRFWKSRVIGPEPTEL